jgi:hypothetical protein
MRFRPALAALAGAAVIAVAALALPAAAPAYGPIIRYECTYQAIGDTWFDIPNCQANVTPWISVGRLGHSGWKLYCPDGAPFLYQNVFSGGVVFGGNSTDWSRSSKWIDAPTASGDRYTGNGQYPDWTVGYAGKNLNPADYTSGWLDAFVVNWSAGGSHSWRYAIGCSAINAPVDNDGVPLPPVPGGPDGGEMLDYPNIVPGADPPQTDDDVAPVAPAPDTMPAQPVTPTPQPIAPPASQPLTPPAPVATAARVRRGEVRHTHLKVRSVATVRQDQRIERLRELPLKPNRTTTVNVTCAAGERLVHGNYAVAYDTPRPPRTNRHADTHTAGRRTYSVRVKVGKVAHDTVWLQARAICQKK